MDMNGGVGGERDRSVRVNIEAQASDPVTMSTPFEPQMSPPRSSTHSQNAAGGAVDVINDDDDGNDEHAAARPERRLTMLALRLAILEKAASGLGALGFIWATVVLLGGFAITLGRVDFWSITVILLIEGARIFSRSHELEWQHQSTSSISLIPSSFRLLSRSLLHPNSTARRLRHRHWRWRRWLSWGFLSRQMGRAFYWLQLASATACVGVSAVRLARQDFGETEDARTNRWSALDIFYSLALAEALLFLTERAMWEWEVTYGKILDRVAADCRLAGVVAVRRFFYDAYSRCVEGSIFDGMRMDLVSFAVELLVGGSHDEQRIGVGVLVAVVDEAALRRVGNSAAVVERLIEMLTWKGGEDGAVARKAAADVVAKLASKKRNALRVAGVPGAIESVASLLHADDVECRLLGLLIVKKLARDHDNCTRIGNARGLLDKIIDFSSVGEGDVIMTAARGKAVKRSLQVVKMLAGTTGSTGRMLRREIAEVVFAVSNIRGVLRLAGGGDGQGELRRLAAEALARLAMDADARDKIGGTGGVVSLLLAARRNCDRILRAGGGGATVARLVDALSDEVAGVGAARILTNLCAYAGGEWFSDLHLVTAGAATTLRNVMMTSSDIKLLEVSLGLAAQMARFMGPHELAHHLAGAGVARGEEELVNRLVNVLATHGRPSIKAPRIRRFTVELAVAMMTEGGRRRGAVAVMMAAAGMGPELRHVAETTSELECFHVFSGSAGLCRHAVSLSALVDTALELMGTRGTEDQ
uniref:Uncharacterized protein n=1 Tax=Leersia perrieri TaxID=77586 RepID=A0A0D9XZW8_9ORYZ